MFSNEFNWSFFILVAPPSFIAARKKDKERLQKVTTPQIINAAQFVNFLFQLCDANEFTSLQIEIDAALERDLKKNRKRKMNVPGTSLAAEEYDESTEADKFIVESIDDVIKEVLEVDADGVPIKSGVKVENKKVVVAPVLGLKPDLIALCTLSEKEHAFLSLNKTDTEVVNDLNLEGLDDDEIDGYILTESEAVLKDRLWNKMNAEYLKVAKEREERAAKEREEGKPEKKKRRSRKKPIGPSSSALDAIQKVLQEKKISSKINYDILKSLTASAPEKEAETIEIESIETKPVIDETLLPRPGTSRKTHFNLSNNRRSKAQQIGFPMATASEDETKDQPVADAGEFKLVYFTCAWLISQWWLTDDIADADDTMEAEDVNEQEAAVEESDRLGDILNQGDDDDYSGPEEYF